MSKKTMKITSFEMGHDIPNNFYIQIFVFSSCVSSAKSSATWRKEKQGFIHLRIHLRSWHSACYLVAAHRSFGDSLVLPFSLWERGKQTAGVMWNMPVLPCPLYGLTEGKIAFIIQSDGRAIQKNCLNLIGDEILILRN